MRQKSTIRVGGPGCAGIAPGHPSATPTHQHQGTLSLVIPALRQGVRGQGEKSFPLPYDRRLSLSEVVQGFAPPGTPFAGSLIRRAGVAALDLQGLPKGPDDAQKQKAPRGSPEGLSSILGPLWPRIMGITCKSSAWAAHCPGAGLAPWAASLT